MSTSPERHPTRMRSGVARARPAPGYPRADARPHDFGQQLGIGAGVAAGRIGQELERSAPKGPTVTLERQSSVGIMFLANLTAD